MSNHIEYNAQSANQRNYEEMLARLVERLTGAGLQVVRSFDKHITEMDCTNTLCPYYAKPTCEHHLAVILVYGAGRPPVTLLLQGCSRHSRLSLANTSHQRVDPELEATITAAVAQAYGQPPRSSA